VLAFIEDEWHQTSASIVLQVDMGALSDMHLGVGLSDIADSIIKAKKLKLKIEPEHVRIGYGRIEIVVDNTWHDAALAKKAAKTRALAAEKGQSVSYATGMMDEASDLLLRVNYLRRMLPSVPISGYPEATRAIIQTSETNENTVLVEGYGLRACMTTEGIIGTKCRTNSVMECRDVLGIEAARTTIAYEIGEVMGDMGIDPRHIQLLADVMTYKGEVLGITRFGLSKMRDSVLQLASFEKTPDHLFDAAAGMKTDRIEGVSECIIMGQTMSIGTGSFSVVRKLGVSESQTMAKPTVFEDAWKKEEEIKKKARDDMKREKIRERMINKRNGVANASAPLVAAMG
jgi:DNA-directed RNA polymerase III subunit RPC1